MSSKRPASSLKRTVLQMPRKDAENRLRTQIRKGEDILQLKIVNSGGLEHAESERNLWSDYNVELLKRIVDSDELADGYDTRLLGGSWHSGPIEAKRKEFHLDIRYFINSLKSVLARLSLIPESDVISQRIEGQAYPPRREVSRRVFVVHGHDEEAKQTVARYLEKLDLEAIILHEQPNKGRTIIEKFEDYADVGFAVVLLTPDDVGSAKEETDNQTPRARQNVIFELGFFVGKLGRQRVCALHKGDVEIPTDFYGVVWVALDSGQWRLDLGRELQAAGLDVDLNKLA